MLTLLIGIILVLALQSKMNQKNKSKLLKAKSNHQKLLENVKRYV